MGVELQRTIGYFPSQMLSPFYSDSRWTLALRCCLHSGLPLWPSLSTQGNLLSARSHWTLVCCLPQQHFPPALPFFLSYLKACLHSGSQLARSWFLAECHMPSREFMPLQDKQCFLKSQCLPTNIMNSHFWRLNSYQLSPLQYLFASRSFFSLILPTSHGG